MGQVVVDIQYKDCIHLHVRQRNFDWHISVGREFVILHSLDEWDFLG